MDRLIECAGDPRAMGNGQGRACGQLVRDRIRESGGRVSRSRIPSLRSLTSGSALGSGMGREVIRHYTHLSERMAGIARHSDVPFESLMELFVKNVSGGAHDSELLAEAVALAGTDIRDAEDGLAILRTLPGSTERGQRWILRRSRPEVGFASAEITLPWLATSLAGVNEAGVAVTIAPRDPTAPMDREAIAAASSSAPHAVLLVQECLQRFVDVDACIDWCLKRPASGDVTLIMADANARLMGVRVAGDTRERVEPEAGWLIAGASSEVSDAVRRAAGGDSGGPSLGLEALGSVGPSPGDLLVWLEPLARRLTVRDLAGKEVERLRVDLDS